MKYFYFTLIFTCFISTVFTQTVAIPDVNFKTYLLNNIAINTNSDGEIQTAEAASFTGTINAENKNISDLTGIEAFINMKDLHCYDNNLTHLDLSTCTNLETLLCGENPLTTLNITGCAVLKTINCSYTSLTNISLTSNTALESLYFQNSLLSFLDLTNNSNLILLRVENNQLNNLDISNSLSITTLIITNNSITSLDLSNHKDLDILWVDSNELVTLNLQNDSNAVLPSFNSQGNPNLSCIQVDDVAWSTANWLAIDATSSFSTNCAVGINENQQKAVINVYPNPANHYFNLEIESNTAFKNLTLRIVDLTGKTVHQQQVNEAYNPININNLAEGFYSVLIFNETQFIASKKLTVIN